MARLMRAMPELLTLIKGMVAASRSVGSTLALLIIFLYIFAIVFTQTLREDPDFKPFYGTLSMSMFTLFMAGTLCDNVIDRMDDLRVLATGPRQVMLYLFVLFILLSSFTV